MCTMSNKQNIPTPKAGDGYLESNLEETALSETGRDDEHVDTTELQKELDALDFGDEESEIDDEDIDLR